MTCNTEFTHGAQPAVRHHRFNLTDGVIRNIQGSSGALTQAYIASPTTAVVQWEGWS